MFEKFDRSRVATCVAAAALLVVSATAGLAVDLADRAPDLAPGNASKAVGVKVHAYLAEIIQQVADEAQ